MEHRAACQCGELVLQAIAEPDFVVACNCQACQRRTGAPFGVGAYFQKQHVSILGTARTWARIAPSGRELVNHFCANCGTNVYWSLEMRPDHLGVALGCITPTVAEPSRAIWTEEKHSWVQFPQHWPQYEKATPE